MQEEVPKWVSYMQSTRQSYIRPLKLTDDYLNHLMYLYNTFVPSEKDFLGIYPISDELQTAFVTTQKEGIGLFYDVGQIAILRSAYAHLYSDDPEMNVFNLFLSSASLRICKRDKFFTDKLGDCWTENYDGESIINSDQLANGKGFLEPLSKEFYQPLYNFIIDSSILNHEFYHYLTEKNQVVPEVEQIVEDYFDLILDHANNDTSLISTDHLDAEKLKKYNIERELIREYFAQPKIRTELKEEIACDIYALRCTGHAVSESFSFLKQDPGGFYTFISLYSIMFNFHALHAGCVRRSEFYSRHDRNDYLKGEMFAYNIRRVAVSFIASILDWSPLFHGLGNYAKNNQTMIKFSEDLQLNLSNIYVDMCDRFIIPVTMRLNFCFDLIEEQFPKKERIESEPISDPNERLFLSALPFRLDQKVAEGLFQDSLFDKISEFMKIE